ncbi:hypothetical protein SLEP1_g59805 [Rubroshorea leprosula]|uniref:Uncharacterized protein n=1 Tax=Rubroshorea leprosula TaxID=152421 RepID=A0AAV5MUQ9_9ROSI|nr:hypothetical protein SLEP1_g59805 [Rubroshorea leprosula]
MSTKNSTYRLTLEVIFLGSVANPAVTARGKVNFHFS